MPAQRPDSALHAPQSHDAASSQPAPGSPEAAGDGVLDAGHQAKASLSLFDSICVIVGIIIGSGIYMVLAPIALHTSGLTARLLEQDWIAALPSVETWLPTLVLCSAWLMGAGIAVCGALCYAELASAYPHRGGDYHYLNRAYGRRLGFFFVWCEFWIVRPANIGAVALVFSEYGLRFFKTTVLARLLDAPALQEVTWTDSPIAKSIVAVAAIVMLTLTNLAGVRAGIRVQNTLSVAKVIGLSLIVLVAFLVPARAQVTPIPYQTPTGFSSFPLAMVLIMFTLGGWNDLAFVAGEVKNPKRNMLRALLLGLAAVTSIYLLVSLACVWGLGFGGVVQSPQVAADLLQSRVGPLGDAAIALLIAISTLGAINGMLYAGSRIYFALGREMSAFRWVGVWNSRWGGPVRALIAQCSVTLLIVLAFGRTADGFERLVNFSTLPFWLFFLLVGIGLIVLRFKEPATPRPYRVHFYPLVPILFCLSSIYVLYSSTTYALSVGGWEWIWAGLLVLVGDWIAGVSFDKPKPTAWRKTLAHGARTGIVALLAASLLMLTRSSNWLGELASHFPFQVAVLAAVMALLARLAGQRVWMGIAVALAAVQMLWTNSTVWPNTAHRQVISAATAQSVVNSISDSESNRELTVVTMNVNVANSQHDAILQTIQAQDADLVILLELSEAMSQELEALRSDYPYQNLAPRADAFGLGVLSRLPSAVAMEGPNWDPSSVLTTPQALVRLTDRAKQVWYFGATHVIPPSSPQAMKDRDQSLATWTQTLSDLPGPVVMIGDFNDTPWSAPFQKRFASNAWHDSRIGFGRQPTWPSRLGWFGIPIDHVMLNRQVQCTARETFIIPGSDHFGVRARLRHVGATNVASGNAANTASPMLDSTLDSPSSSPASPLSSELDAQDSSAALSVSSSSAPSPSLAGSTIQDDSALDDSPEPSLADHVAMGRDGVVASVHPAATAAGIAMFEQGGNAVDAAIATALALSVCNPYNSGLGGGCFVLIRTSSGEVLAIDGRETAPIAAYRELFVEADARRALGDTEPTSQTGPLASGVPGALAAYALALKQAGSLELAQVLEPSIRLAREGCRVDQPLANAIIGQRQTLARDVGAAAIFLPEGKPLAAGELWLQGDLANTYQRIAEEGPEWFYRGEFAQRVAAWMKEHGGLITADDFDRYRAIEREAISSTYRGYRIVGFPPPSSGGVHVAQMLTMLERFDLQAMRKRDPVLADQVAIEAMKRAFADRAHWLGDPDWADVPRGLLDLDYLTERGRDIQAGRASAVTSHGNPPDPKSRLFERHTTHIAAADAQGNWVAITATINTTFGSKVVVPGTGVVLNNEMDDFAIAPGVPNAFGLIGAEANRVEPTKRPLSSMSPTIVFADDQPIMAVGAAGGPKIITQVLWAILRTIDDRQSIGDALTAPRLHHQWSPDRLFIERGYDASAAERLEAMGYEIEWMSASGVSQAVALDRDRRTLIGAHDPRVPGAAQGYSAKNDEAGSD